VPQLLTTACRSQSLRCSMRRGCTAHMNDDRGVELDGALGLTK
jgi:hypothetical protein